MKSKINFYLHFSKNFIAKFCRLVVHILVRENKHEFPSLSRLCLEVEKAYLVSHFIILNDEIILVINFLEALVSLIYSNFLKKRNFEAINKLIYI